VANTLDLLVPQVARVGGEVLVVSGLPNAVPPLLPPTVRSLVLTSHDAFVLHAEAMRMSRGEIVAIGEDHVRFGFPNRLRKSLRLPRAAADAPGR
jgi:hypothetical protein